MKTPIKSLTLGNKTFPVNIIQGPLAGVSSAPFRHLTWQYGKPAFSCTEMLSCKTVLHQSEKALQRLIKIHPKEGPVCFQLSSTDPTELGEATKRITHLGAYLIDLNCGCPVNKIRRRGAGSRLLTNPTLLYQLIKAMKENTHLPVSIKIRVEGGSEDSFHKEIAQVVSDAGADFLTVHGRHWTEHYETPCRYDDIQFFVETLNIPVIGNGDVACVKSLLKMFATGCAGVMIGRAGVGKPWLIQQLIAEINHETFEKPSWFEIGEIFLTHIEQLTELLGSEKFAILQSRTLAKYYAKTHPQQAELVSAVNGCDHLKDLREICRRVFQAS